MSPPGDVPKILIRVFGLFRFLPLRFSFRPYAVDVLDVVINTPTLVLRCVGDHDMVGVSKQDLRVELFALANGASCHLLTPTPRLRLRPKLVGDVSVYLAALVLALVRYNEAPTVVRPVLARRLLYLLQPGSG